MKNRKMISVEDDTYEVSDQFLSQVLETAVEGACSYWADISAEYSDDEAGKGGVRDFDVSDYVDDEDADENNGDDGEPLYTEASFLVSKDPSQGGTLDLQGVADAIERIANGEAAVPAAIREIIITAVHESDASEIDSEAADCIVQIGLFDEVVYS